MSKKFNRNPLSVVIAVEIGNAVPKQQFDVYMLRGQSKGLLFTGTGRTDRSAEVETKKAVDQWLSLVQVYGEADKDDRRYGEKLIAMYDMVVKGGV